LLYQKKPCFYLELDPKVQAWKNIINKKKNISEYSCIQKDGTVIKVGSEYIWIWWVATTNHRTKKFSEWVYQKNDKYVFVAIERFIYFGCCRRNVEHPVVSTEMVEHGILNKPVDSWNLIIIYILLYTRMRKALLKELCNISKTEPKNISMISSDVEKRNVN
jgi:hypothetical protein